MGVEADAASTPTVEQAGQASKGLDDAISAALNASETGDDYPPQLLKEKSAQKSEDKAKPAKAAKAAETEDESAGDKASEEQAEEASPSKQEGEEEEGGEPASVAAPKHWPEADRKAFSALPKEGQDLVLKLSKSLQGGFTRKSQELSDKARFAETVYGLIDEATRDQISRTGMDEVGYFRYLHSLQQAATTNPIAYARFVIQNLGISPDQLFTPQPQQPQGQAQQADPMADLLVDPAVKQLEARLAQLQGIVEREQWQKQEAARTHYVNSVSSIQRDISSFRQSLDEQGQLRYPHFDQVQKHMGGLMETDPELLALPDGEEKLQKAYDMAIWARPDLRSTYLDQEAQKRLQQAQKKQDAERAKRATAIKPAAGTVTTRPKSTTLDDAISSTMSKFGL